ncbi:MAG: hypothetical protein E6R13_00360 [Spirochaetes bacterium]|nr:MAG: hypothetical protein E6R13_00360 [Spirochaetota bacterium]
MKASLVEKVGKYEIPLYYMRGNRKLYSQDFVSVQNLLIDNSDFQATLTGVLFTAPRQNLSIKSAGIELTAEFFKDTKLNILIPLWYKYSVTLPIESTSVEKKSVSVTSVPGQQFVEIKNLKTIPSQHIVTNRATLRINGETQSQLAFTINHAEGSIITDLSKLPPAEYLLEVTYELVELNFEVQVYEGVYGIRVRYHFRKEYLIDILTSSDQSALISYRYKSEPKQEVVVPEILYKQLEPEFVGPETYTFAYTDTIKFPSYRSFLLFAIRAKRPEFPTVFGPREPLGLDFDKPWFIRLEGILPSKYVIDEVSESQEYVEGRKQRAVVLTKNKIRIGARNLVLNRTSSGRYLKGIDVYTSSGKENLIPVLSYDIKSGIITLDAEVPLDAVIYVEFRELVDWVDYEGIQFNPILADDQDYILKNKFIIYADFNSPDPERHLYHIAIPKIVAGEFYDYSLQDLRNIVANHTSSGLAIALVELVESTDEDYYFPYDIRPRGGYSGSKRKLVDRIFWDGEDVDLTGQFFTFVPRKVVEDRLQLEQKWNVGIDPVEAELVTRGIIEKVIIGSTRIGMSNKIIYEGEG